MSATEARRNPNVLPLPLPLLVSLLAPPLALALALRFCCFRLTSAFVAPAATRFDCLGIARQFAKRGATDVLAQRWQA